MDNFDNKIEILERQISEFQKQISIKREILKNELDKDNDSMIDVLHEEIAGLKEKIVFFQSELRKMFLRQGNKKLEVDKGTSVKYDV